MNKKLDQEQKRLDTVIETITEQIDKLENETGRRRAEVINIRKHFWDDVKVNTDTFDDYLETVINLRQQAQSLAVTQITHKHTFNRLAALRRMHKAPYFGRIDFKEEGEIWCRTNLYRGGYTYRCKRRKLSYIRLARTNFKCLLRLSTRTG